MATGPLAQAGTIEKVDAALDALVPAGARIEKLAGGFAFTEGPISVSYTHLTLPTIYSV